MGMESTRTALITGAAGGLGFAISERLASSDCRVALVDIDADKVKKSASRIDGAVGLGCDVTDEAQVVDTLAKFTEIFTSAPDILVNNAGIVRFGSLLEQSVEDFRRVVDVNLIGTFVVSKVVGAAMIARGTGAIVNITSLNAFAPSPDAGAYPATKAAIAKLTEQMTLTFAPKGIRVNAVAPGFMDAGMSQPIYVDPAVRAVRAGGVPAGRIGTADDVAAAVAFLVSPEADYIHGQHLLVDGGVSCSLKNHLPRKPPKEAEK